MITKNTRDKTIQIRCTKEEKKTVEDLARSKDFRTIAEMFWWLIKRLNV